MLIFSSSIIFAVPAGFLIASVGATSYRLYNADYSGYAIWKRLGVLILIVVAATQLRLCSECFSCVNDINMDRFRINFGQDREEIYREENNSWNDYDYKEEYDDYDYDKSDGDNWDEYDDEGW